MLLKIEFKPLEPYFFGNERSLQYKGVNQKVQIKAASYFAKSELIPLQSTLFGALRYLGIVEKRLDFKLTSEDEANIGKASFQLKKEGQSFGKIKSISQIKKEMYIFGCQQTNRTLAKKKGCIRDLVRLKVSRWQRKMVHDIFRKSI